MAERDDYTPAALYARVSSDRQDVDLSVSAQLRALRDHARKNGYMVVGEFVDEAESGRIADRPQFRRMIDEATKPEAPFREILVWKFSRFTRKREHAVAFKSMLRRKGVRVVSITEHADDTPTGKLLEAIIESVDEFYSENLAQEVTRGMREASSRGFWISSHAPYGYNRVMVQDGPKKRPTLEIDPDASRIVKRMFDMAEAGDGTLEIIRTLNNEGIASPRGKLWARTSVHNILTNEAYTGTLVWGANAKDNADPVRVEKAFPAIITRAQFQRVGRHLSSRRAQVQPPPQSRKLLPAQRPAQVQDVQDAAHRQVRPERQVLLLRLPVEHQARQGRLQDSHAQRSPLRGACRRQDSLRHPHRGQHQRAVQGGGRGDGQSVPRAAQEASDH